MALHRIPAFTAPAPGELVQVNVAGRAVAVAVVGDRVLAVADACTHLRCSLSGGEVQDGAVVCPCHFAAFDLVTGEVRRGPAVTALRTYPASVVDDVLHLELPD